MFICFFVTLISYTLHQVDYIAYADDIAEQIGCRPDIFKMFLKDPIFGFRCLFGPCAPYQYRLVGPGCWDGAKKALEDIPKNIVLPTRTRFVKHENDGRKMYLYIILFVAIVAVLFQMFLNGT